MPVLKKCPQCGLFHDISVNRCTCGGNLLVTQPERMDMPPADKRGDIGENVPVYVQVCPGCGTENFTDTPSHKRLRCRACRVSIGAQTPVLWDESFVPPTPAPKAESAPKEVPSMPKAAPAPKVDPVPKADPAPAAEPEQTPAEEAPKAPVYVQWCSYCQTNNFTDSPEHKLTRCTSCGRNRIANVTPVLWEPEKKEEKKEPVEETAGPKPIKEEERPDPTPTTTSWASSLQKLGVGSVLSGGATPVQTGTQTTEEKKPEPPTPKNLRLVAFGSLTGLDVAFTPEDKLVLLGWYAGDILDPNDPRKERFDRIERFCGRDERISSYHCQFVFRDNRWHVIDGSFGLGHGIKEKASTNGTFVNGQQVSEKPLSAGDVVKLGTKPDSVTIRVELT